ncbi:hypothetical protein DIURU_000389 [Diutina rugosa]|uniref:TLC domain-containing protein n=1 Tax=Diutina rugosa TaxID=5481 RepID=A0A642UYA9_DIURU|nr:uncharacterized protein DIURU_000389 [Diutina rugosa]KAA8907702.1 hypothetical protein DIURU_000389 [Diutina rugosa]
MPPRLPDWFPVIEHDPFLKYRPFPATTDNNFVRHWHEVAGSFLIYTAVQMVSPYVSSWVFGDNYRKLSKKTRLNFDIHVVSMVQCILSVVALLPTWNHPNWQNRANDPVTSLLGFNDYYGLVSAITTGYFLWDLMVCLVHFKIFGFGFLFHAFAALWVFGASFYPFNAPWIPAFLLFELSTPFVNINWFATRLPAGAIPEWVVVVNGLLLLFTFFSVRIVWGFYSVALLAYDMWQMKHLVPWYLPVMNLGLNLCLDGLNVFWFSKMLAIAYKKLSGSPSKSKQA